ncbi:hypothetical protein [Limimaricola cinnabarinus]|uniref:hypothetical protein n=1 Tax=Limimaricola cinnabarinus TaxID=1125964 RepID=UPI0024901C9A|nr:hypothetical protein [Limimaricola cinnabarinus]
MTDIRDLQDNFDPTSVDHSMQWRWSLRWKGDEHARLDLVLGPGEEPDKTLEGRLDAAVGDGWEVDGRRHEPTTRLPYRAPSSRARADILDDLERRLGEAGVRHACCVQAFPTGWLHIAMVLVVDGVIAEIGPRLKSRTRQAAQPLNDFSKPWRRATSASALRESRLGRSRHSSAAMPPDRAAAARGSSRANSVSASAATSSLAPVSP